VGLLDITVGSGEFGPVVKLSGEADTSVTGQLSDALNAQISPSTRHLTVDLSGLRFADSAAVHALVDAHLALKGQGGLLELTGPQPMVARTLSLLGIDQVIPVRPQVGSDPAGTGDGSGSLRDRPLAPPSPLCLGPTWELRRSAVSTRAVRRHLVISPSLKPADARPGSRVAGDACLTQGWQGGGQPGPSGRGTLWRRYR